MAPAGGNVEEELGVGDLLYREDPLMLAEEEEEQQYSGQEGEERLNNTDW